MARPSYINKYSAGDTGANSNTSNSYPNQYQKQKQYENQSVMTMTQGELMLKLYDEIIKQLNIGVEAIDEEPDINRRSTALLKSQKIINHLRMSLNFEYEISNKLYGLYEFFVKYIVEANLKNESAHLIQIIPLVQDLRDAYAEAEKSLKSEKL